MASSGRNWTACVPSLIGKVEAGAIDHFQFEAGYKEGEGWEPGVYSPTTTQTAS